MNTSPALSKYILGGIVVALLTIGVSGSPINVLYGDLYPLPHPQAVAEPVSSTRLVDRSHKSDRKTHSKGGTCTATRLRNSGEPVLQPNLGPYHS
jgi:hypothetical protein